MKGDESINIFKTLANFCLLILFRHYNRKIHQYILIKMLYGSTSSFLIDIAHQKWSLKILEQVLSIHLVFIFDFNIENTCIKSSRFW